jgi:L-rhamnose mutarotase
MKYYCLTLQLRDDPELIAEYEAHHQHVWPSVLRSLQDAGILSMQIYRIETRLFMSITTTDDFSFEKKSMMDNANPEVMQWEALMAKYQYALPGTNLAEKWQPMDKVFDFTVQ